MLKFFEAQLDGIYELLTIKSEEGSLRKKIFKIIGNVLFIMTFLVLAWKSLDNLFELWKAKYLVAFTVNYPILTRILCTLPKQGYFWLALLILLAIVMRAILFIKDICKPYELLGYIAYIKVAYSLALIVFLNDEKEYITTLKDLLKPLPDILIFFKWLF